MVRENLYDFSLTRSRIEINPDSGVHNLRVIRSVVGPNTKIMVVFKCNAHNQVFSPASVIEWTVFFSGREQGIPFVQA